jgi:hypothetical protein
LTVRVRKSEVQKNCTCTEKKKTVHVQKKKSLTPQNSSLFILFIAGCSLFFDEFLGSMKVLHLLSVSPALRELQVRRHLRQFYLSLLVALRVRSQKQNTQLFYLSLLSKWFGLSYRGLSMQQTLGVGVAASTFQRRSKQFYEQASVSLVTELTTTTNIFWLDNCVKAFVEDYVIADYNTHEARRATDITVLGVIVTGPQPVLLDADAIFVNCDIWNALPLFLDSIRELDFSPGSLAVGIVPQLEEPVHHEDLLFPEPVTRLSLDDFRALEVLPFSPGSPDGQFQSILWILERQHLQGLLHKVVICADIGFAERWWKFCLSGHRLSYLKDHAAVVLGEDQKKKKKNCTCTEYLLTHLVLCPGLWHPWVHFTKSLWSWARPLTSRLYEMLFPHSTFTDTPRGTRAGRLLTCFSAAAFTLLESDPTLLGRIGKLPTKTAKLLYFFFANLLPVAQSYKNALRSGQWQSIFTALHKIWYGFSIMDNPVYTRTIFAFLTSLHFWKEQGSSLYDLISSQPHLFNEEVGELSLSFVARTLQKQNKHLRFEAVQKAFTQMTPLRQLTKQWDQALSVSQEAASEETDANNTPQTAAAAAIARCGEFLKKLFEDVIATPDLFDSEVNVSIPRWSAAGASASVNFWSINCPRLFNGRQEMFLNFDNLLDPTQLPEYMQPPARVPQEPRTFQFPQLRSAAAAAHSAPEPQLYVFPRLTQGVCLLIRR